MAKFPTKPWRLSPTESAKPTSVDDAMACMPRTRSARPSSVFDLQRSTSPTLLARPSGVDDSNASKEAKPTSAPRVWQAAKRKRHRKRKRSPTAQDAKTITAICPVNSDCEHAPDEPKQEDVDAGLTNPISTLRILTDNGADAGPPNAFVEDQAFAEHLRQISQRMEKCCQRTLFFKGNDLKKKDKRE